MVVKIVPVSSLHLRAFNVESKAFEYSFGRGKSQIKLLVKPISLVVISTINVNEHRCILQQDETDFMVNENSYLQEKQGNI